MSSRAIAACLVLVFVSAAAVSAQTGERVSPSARVTTFVHIRAAADARSAERGRLRIGESLALVRSMPRWYEVELPGGGRGFVAKAWTTVTHPLQARAEDELRIHFLNVGTGSCALVECPGANAPRMIVDCGSLGASADDMDAAQARTYIQASLAASTERPNVVLSHADRDHYRFIAEVLNGTQAGHIWQGGDPDEYDGDGFPAWLTEQRKGGATVHDDLPEDFSNGGDPVGDALNCGLANSYILTVNTGADRNTQSLVLMLEYNEFTAIFTGDAEGETEAQATNNFGNNLKATVLTGSHHGADTKGSNSQDWINATAPDLVVFSAGERFGHPRCTAVARFNTTTETTEHAVRCGTSNTTYGPVTRTREARYMTEVSGAVIVTSDGHSPLWVHCARRPECNTTISH